MLKDREKKYLKEKEFQKYLCWTKFSNLVSAGGYTILFIWELKCRWNFSKTPYLPLEPVFKILQDFY